MDIAACMAAIEAAVDNGEASLSTDIGGHQELTTARLWRGQVLVDWEADPRAGGCLLRPDLLRRLLALHASFTCHDGEMVVQAPGRVVAAMSPHHADLVRGLGGARRVELEARLRFAGDEYRGGQETYFLIEHGRKIALLGLTAEVRLRSGLAASPRSSPGPT